MNFRGEQQPTTTTTTTKRLESALFAGSAGILLIIYGARAHMGPGPIYGHVTEMVTKRPNMDRMTPILEEIEAAGPNIDLDMSKSIPDIRKRTNKYIKNSDI